MDKDIRPYLLSKVLDFHLVGTEEEVELRRKLAHLRDHVQSTRDLPVFNVGSHGDGFDDRLCSDKDYMTYSEHFKVMYPDMYNDIAFTCKKATVLFIRHDDCGPGFVRLELYKQVKNIPRSFRKAIVPVYNSLFLSSDILREEFFTEMNPEGMFLRSSGPSTKGIYHNVEIDYVIAFRCIGWPNDAYEWLNRPRLFGWPSEGLITKIQTFGCHLVPVGDKCSSDTILQWRISFTVAEQALVHSLNHIQFKVYGLLKYLLRQIKYRMRHDIGDDDILCSYFMKTLIFYCVENSPKSLWQEKNIFVCFWFCFSTLLDWVQSGYCPNYFIPANNMFQRKVHGIQKVKLLNILWELHEMRWGIFSIESPFSPSIWKILHSSSSHVKLIHLQSPTEREYRIDDEVNTSILLCDPFGKESIQRALLKMNKSQCDTDELFSYACIICFLRDSAKRLCKIHGNRMGNKLKYISMRKCKQWLSPSFGVELLYLASFYYQIGNYKKAVQLCEGAVSSIAISDDRYREMFCGKGYSAIYKVQKTFETPITFTSEVPELCPPELLLEVQSNFQITAPAVPYAMLLTFLCHHTLGNNKECYKTLHKLEGKRYHDGGIWNSIVHTFLGICYQTKRDYHSAELAYLDALRCCDTEDKSACLQRIKALQSYKRAENKTAQQPTGL